MHDNHPVLLSLDAQHQALLESYRRQPCEQSRYRLVRLEQLIRQWAPHRSSL